MPKIITKTPFTVPRTVPPIIYANDISIADNGAVNISGSCCSNFICNMDEDVFAVAFVRVFIIKRPGRINNVYGTPLISSIRRSSVNPKTTMYNPDDINPGRTV